MHQTKIKILALIMLTTVACVEENEEQVLTMHEAEVEAQVHSDTMPDAIKAEPHQQATSQVHSEKDVEDTIISNQDCVPEILIAEASATSRSPSEIKFEIRGTECDSDVLFYSSVIYSGEVETPLGRGWTELEVLESETGHFALAGELWSCGSFGGADHVELVAHSESGASRPLLVPINLVEEKEGH